MKKMIVLVLGALFSVFATSVARAQANQDTPLEQMNPSEELDRLQAAGLITFSSQAQTSMIDELQVAQKFGQTYVDNLRALTQGKANIIWAKPGTMALGGQEGQPER